MKTEVGPNFEFLFGSRKPCSAQKRNAMICATMANFRVKRNKESALRKTLNSRAKRDKVRVPNRLHQLLMKLFLVLRVWKVPLPVRVHIAKTPRVEHV